MRFAIPGQRLAPTFARFTVNVMVDLDTHCWNWIGSISGGYGQLSDGGRTTPAHRYAYRQYVGPIPDGLDLDHLCLHRTCVNPWHLEPVTRKEHRRRQFA